MDLYVRAKHSWTGVWKTVALLFLQKRTGKAKVRSSIILSEHRRVMNVPGKGREVDSPPLVHPSSRHSSTKPLLGFPDLAH